MSTELVSLEEALRNNRSMTRGVEEAHQLIVDERDADVSVSDSIQEEPGTEGGQEDKETCQGKHIGCLSSPLLLWTYLKQAHLQDL